VKRQKVRRRWLFPLVIERVALDHEEYFIRTGARKPHAQEPLETPDSGCRPGLPGEGDRDRHGDGDD
jgi:hypothetical protein